MGSKIGFARFRVTGTLTTVVSVRSASIRHSYSDLVQNIRRLHKHIVCNAFSRRWNIKRICGNVTHFELTHITLKESSSFSSYRAIFYLHEAYVYWARCAWYGKPTIVGDIYWMENHTLYSLVPSVSRLPLTLMRPEFPEASSPMISYRSLLKRSCS